MRVSFKFEGHLLLFTYLMLKSISRKIHKVSIKNPKEIEADPTANAERQTF